MEQVNVDKLPLVGQGSHGKVYRLDEKRCIKVCKKEKHMQMEFKVLKHAERFPQFPRVYECKGNYMIREYCDGPGIEEYIQKNGLSKSLALKILELFDIFKELGFTRFDCQLSHLIVTEGENLKMIDPTRNMDKLGDYPRHLLRGFDRLGCKKQFLNYVQELRPHYYEHWKNY